MIYRMDAQEAKHWTNPISSFALWLSTRIKSGKVSKLSADGFVLRYAAHNVDLVIYLLDIRAKRGLKISLKKLNLQCRYIWRLVQFPILTREICFQQHQFRLEIRVSTAKPSRLIKIPLWPGTDKSFGIFCSAPFPLAAYSKSSSARSYHAKSLISNNFW